jgi:hypothetical protein
MGNSPSSASSANYELSKEIEKAIEMDTLVPTTIINLAQEIFLNPFQHKYIIKLHSRNIQTQKIYLLFPTHPLQKKRSLSVSEFTSKSNVLSKEINQRIQEERGDKCILIAYAEKIYQIINIKGPIYFLWAERINLQTVNQQENLIEEFIPILIETNGQFTKRNVFLIPSGELLNNKDVSIIQPIQYSLYCCETDNRKDVQLKIHTLSNSQADMITKDPVARTLVTMDREEVPFTTSDEEGELKIIPNTERHLNYRLEKSQEGEFDEEIK